MGNFDVFYDAQESRQNSHTSRTATLSGNTDIGPGATDIVLTSATTFVEGQRLLLWDGATALAYAYVSKVTDSTHITVLPIQSASDTVTLPYTFPNTTAISTLDESPTRCVIDLSEAPEDSYNYLIIGYGTIESTGTPGGATAFLRTGVLQGDPYSGTTGYGSARVDCDSTVPNRPNWVGATTVTLAGGTRSACVLLIQSSTSAQTATMSDPGVIALRYSSGYIAGDGKTTEQTTTSTSYVDVTGLDLGVNIPAGQYLIVSTWAATNSSTSNRVDVVLEADGSTVLANQVAKPNTANDYIPSGFCGLVTLGATNRVRLRIKASATTAKIKNAFLAAIPVANLPAIAGVHASQDLATDFSQSVTDNNFVTAKTSGSVTLTSGRHIEIISASIGGSLALRSRPEYDDDAGGTLNSLGNHNVIYGTSSTDYCPTFWFTRRRRDAGATTNLVTMRRQTASTTTLRARDFTFSWLREKADFVPQPDERMAVVADIELGGRLYRSWNPTTTAGRYFKRLSDVTYISRVIVNDTEYTRVASTSALADGAFFWDSTNLDLYIELPSADTPADNDVTVIVIPSILVGREKENLVNSDGTTLPYLPMLKDVPGSTQRLSSRGGKYETSTSLGALKLVAADGRFDDSILSPATFEGYRAKVRRGYTRQSSNLVDFEVVADATLGLASTDFATLTFRLFDRRLLIQRPIATTKITVREGTTNEREDQPLPILYGSLKRVVAYRIQNNLGGTDYNEFQYCGHGIKSISSVYLDGKTSKAIAGASLTTTSTYTDVGKLRVKNDAFPTPTEPGDVVYVDLIGATSDGLSTGTALQTAGAIARHLLTTYGGVEAKHLVEPTFRMIDRTWRSQRVNGEIVPTPPKIGLVIDDSMSSEDALAELCNSVFAYYKVNRQGRIALDVPDLGVGNLCVNGGFEEDSTSGYPWGVINSATFAIATSRKYDGAQSAEVSNGSPANDFAALSQSITLPSGGMFAVTMLASLITGKATRFRIGVVGPSGTENLSDSMTIQGGAWTRHSFVFTTEPGDSGHAELRIYPAYNSTTQTSVAIDNVEIYKVAAVLDATTSSPLSMSFLDEHYYEAAVTYAVNPEAKEWTPKRIMADPESRGLSALLPSESMYANKSSKRLEVETLATDGSSAAGIGAPIVLHYSRQRHEIDVSLATPTRIPIVGEYLFHQLQPRIPEMPNGYPIWRITEVKYDDANAKIVKVKAQRQQDPVVDRTSITPDAIPMGGIAITLSASAITDYDEMSSEMGDQFVMAVESGADTDTQNGGLYHSHDLTHTHPIASHTHTPGSLSIGVDVSDIYGRYGSNSSSIYVSRGLNGGGHTHTIAGSAVVGNTESTSAPQTGSLRTTLGPNEPSYRRVRFMLRSANTVATISQDLIIGYRSASVPAGWTRVTDLDGYFIRGATTRTNVSTNVTTSTFATSDSGSTLNVASGTNIVVGRRLTITNTADSNKVVHVVVTAGSGTAWTVFPLHETGDQANGYSFPTGAGSTVTGATEAVNTAFTAPNHDHAGSIASHVHDGGGHTHTVELDGETSGESATVRIVSSSGPLLATLASYHTHTADIGESTGDGTTSGSAAGTVSGNSTPLPPYYELVFIKPSDANQKTLPTGAILFWAQSDDPPYGYRVLSEAHGYMICGAATSSAAPGASAAYHVHQQSDSSHSYTHSHGGVFSGFTTGSSPTSTQVTVSAFDEDNTGSYTFVNSFSHLHSLSGTLASTNPTLTANSSHDTPAAESDSLPYHKKLILIQKM